LFKVPGWNFSSRAPFTRTAAKAQGLWNCQNRRAVAANQIKAAVGKKLITPCVTRWNSYYDSCADLLKVLEDADKKDMLNDVICRQDLATFFETDQRLLSQYCKIMQPVAACLDSLQSEEKAYMGNLLPTLKLMKDRLAALRTDPSIIEGQELVNFLLKNPDNGKVAFSGRFQPLFEDMELLMATALHPHFKLAVVGYLNEGLKELIRNRVISEVFRRAVPEEEVDQDQVQGETEDDPFMYMREADIQPNITPGRLKEDFVNAYDGWNRVKVSSKIPLSAEQFPLLYRDAWLDLFVRYNTALPSSAAVERLFSTGSDILRPKRSTLTADNFEKLVFLKGNLHLLTASKWQSTLSPTAEENE
jgi:hypothetical protein